MIHVLCALLALFWASGAVGECRPSGRGTFTAGLEALGRGDLEAAAALFDQLVKAQPDCAEARNNLAAVLVEQGRIDEAAEQLRRALELRPDYPRARLNLAHLETLRAGQRAALQAEPVLKAAAPTPAAPEPTPAQPAAPPAAPPVQHASVTPPTSISALEPQGATACVIDAAQSRVCVYRRGAEAIAMDACYPIVGVQVRSWPQWLTASDLTAKRIRLVDERGQKRLKIVPDDTAPASDTVRLRKSDFEALAAKVVPWRAGWVVLEERGHEPGPAATSPSVEALRDALEHWRQAWEGKQLDAYVGSYSQSFTPQSEGDAARWRARKQRLFEQSGPISVQVTAPSIFILDRGGTAIMAFEQSYRSGVSASRGFKALRWQREGERWTISGETMLFEEPQAQPPTGG